jgi:poly(ribitol-phosphate) beta-N-acetylglucosaminyltransferase
MCKRMPKVSVIVPVYDPGDNIDDCIRTLLGQSMPAGECELIFVDDGSTDGTGARLDALAAEHPHVRVEHIPNSGWPGRPRNIGIEMARGDYVYFVDNDDWLGAEALSRLHAMALEDDADIVIGKVVGHEKQSPRGLFRQNLHGVPFEGNAMLLGLLTPHKLFRRSFLLEHGLRFPEGRRRLEDHLFVVEAYFRARRISVLADYSCYHWVSRGRDANASTQRFDPEGYFDNVREVLDLVEQNTEPGEFRDEVLMHWYRGKMLRRVGGAGFIGRDAEYRRELYEAVRKLALERYGEDVQARLPFNLRARSRLLRKGRYDTLVALAEYESSLRTKITLRRVRAPGPHLLVRVEARLAPNRLAFVRHGDRIVWEPPEQLRGAFAEDDLDVTEAIQDSRVYFYLRALDGVVEHPIPAGTTVRLNAGKRPGRVRPVLVATARISPTTAGGGWPLPAGQWDLRAAVQLAGFSSATRIKTDDGEPLVLTSVPPSRVVVGEPEPQPLPLRIATRAPRLTDTVRRTRARAGAAVRG